MTKLLTEWDPRLKRKPPMLAEAKMDILTDARKKAEAAVADMPDPDLKRTAFQVILKHLLDQSAASGGTGASGPRHIAAARGQASDARRGPVSRPGSTSDRILALLAEGFFDSGRGIGEIRDELQVHGWMYGLTAISGPLMKLVRRRQLRRVQSGNGRRKAYRYFKP